MSFFALAARLTAVGAAAGAAFVVASCDDDAALSGSGGNKYSDKRIRRLLSYPVSPAFQGLGSFAPPANRDGILAAVGNTPLVHVKSLSEATGCRILVKMESMNPGGSVKDRAALSMIEDLERQGRLKPGVTTITEGTGGNTGIGLALVARAKNVNVKLAMPRTIAQEKIQLMRALGAQVVLCDPVPFTNVNHYFHTARRMAEESPEDHFFTNQFENLSNGAAHYFGTAPEIFEQTSGEVHGFVCSAGTGGTINGVSNFLKERNRDIQVGAPRCWLCARVQHMHAWRSSMSWLVGRGLSGTSLGGAHVRVSFFARLSCCPHRVNATRVFKPTRPPGVFGGPLRLGAVLRRHRRRGAPPDG